MKKSTNEELYVVCPKESKTYAVEETYDRRNSICPVCGKLLSDKYHKVLRA